MSGHSTLGPSKAKQWMNCHGSIALCAKVPKQAPNYAAEEGTVAHSLAEKYVTGTLDDAAFQDLIGETVMSNGLEIEIIEEMYDGAVEYRDLIEEDRAKLAEMGSKSVPVHGYAEKRVGADSIDPEHKRVWGTSDYILFKKGAKLIVYDYKFGQGVIVDPEENEQASLYLLGAMETIAGEAFSELEVVIHQPRGRHADGSVRRWTASKEWLAQFKEKAKYAAAQTLVPDAKIVAGDWCRWCTAKPFCPTVHKAAQESAMMAFSPVGPNPIDENSATHKEALRLLPIEKLSEMLKWKEAAKALFIAVEDVMLEHLSAGNTDANWKLVDGKEGNRQWIDEDAVVAHFGAALGHDKMYTKKVISPAALEKIIGKKNAAVQLAPFVTRKPGHKTIARCTDPRPIAATAAQDAFKVIETTAVKPGDDDDLMSQLGASPAAPSKREPMWPQ